MFMVISTDGKSLVSRIPERRTNVVETAISFSQEVKGGP